MSKLLQPIARASARSTMLCFLLVLVALLWTSPGVDFYLASPDHGYQLALATLVLQGAQPFVDVMFHYGPLVAGVSAVAQSVAPGLIGETVVCAAGYSAAIALLFSMASRRLSIGAGWAIALVGFLTLARFYKWYYWLLPVAVLYCLDRRLDSARPRRWDLLAGAVAGIAALFRLDLGLACVAFYVTALATGLASGSGPRQRARWVLSFLAFWAIPMALWLAQLTYVGGLAAIGDYFFGSIGSARGAVAHWSLPFPRPTSLVSEESAHLVMLLLMPAVYLCAVYAGARQWRSGLGGATARLLSAAGLMGLAIFPQACHRIHPLYVLQVIAPFLLAAPLLASAAWREARWARSFVCAGCVLLLLAAPGFSSAARFDNVSLFSNPVPRFRDLSLGLAASQRSEALIVREIQQRTESEDRILVLPLSPQIVHFADRPISGLIPAYARGIFDSDEWRRRNLERVRAEPPRFIVARPAFFRGAAGFRQTQPELQSYLEERYTKIVYRAERWMLISRPNAGGTSR